MNRQEIFDFVGDKFNEIFWEVLKNNGIESGDIAPDDSLNLETIQNSLTDMLLKVVEYNK